MRGLFETECGLFKTERDPLETGCGLFKTDYGLFETAHSLLKTGNGLIKTERGLFKTVRGPFETADGLLRTGVGVLVSNNGNGILAWPLNFRFNVLCNSGGRADAYAGYRIYSDLLIPDLLCPRNKDDLMF